MESAAGVPFVDQLAAYGERLAIVSSRGDGLTYGELADRVSETAARLGHERRLVVVATTNDVDSLVAYLAALAGRHPVVLSASDDQRTLDTLIDRFDPDVLWARSGGGFEMNERRPGSAHVLHPDLALLLPTSGSTGSPKLVRLSHRNVQANSESIAAYLGITDSDRAITSLPIHYCYGLSVVHTHLLRGAGLILTTSSVVEADFWDDAVSCGATSFAGVPYTFELLERIDFEARQPRSLRYITQAGGKMPAGRIRSFAEMGARDGWQLFVMYGQTEATARMSYVPPELLLDNLTSIGIPIRGGSFEIDTTARSADASTGEGELVYRGPNVMLGYAEDPADLGLGPTLAELHTGDIGRRTEQGLWEVVGRISRFLKLFGLRLDLDQIEHVVSTHGHSVVCTGTDEVLVVATTEVDAEKRLASLIVAQFKLPPTAVRVCTFAEIPRLSNGKPDYALIRERTLGDVTRVTAERAPVVGNGIRDVFAAVLQNDAVTPESTFISLGGDSLSYVEMSIRLEEALGFLPRSWYSTTVGDLERLSRNTNRDSSRRRVRFGQVETSVVLRALGIVLIVSSHLSFFDIKAGGFVLMAVAGFNFARFQVPSVVKTDRIKPILNTIVRIAIPTMLVMIIMVVFRHRYYGAWNILLMNDIVGPITFGERWLYWFIEALIQILLVLALVFSIPAIRRLQRLHPYEMSVGVLAATLAVRYGTELISHPAIGTGARALQQYHVPQMVAWLFAIGWVAHYSNTARRKLVLTAIVLAMTPGFAPEIIRYEVMIAALIGLLWIPSLPIPWPLNRLIGVVASASMYIYLTHWDVLLLLGRHGARVGSRGLITAVALAFGIAVWMVATRFTNWFANAVRHRRSTGSFLLSR